MPTFAIFVSSLFLDIANAVAMTFQSIESANLKAYLHLDGQKFSDFVKAQAWTETNGVVSIPVNKDNEAKTTVLTENIKFERKDLYEPWVYQIMPLDICHFLTCCYIFCVYLS